MRKRPGFTLIELLVVISIIALLVGILLPSLSKGRNQARRAACAANLKQIGIGLQGYLNDHLGRLPHASNMPSIGPDPLLTSTPIRICDVLNSYLGDQAKVFECPNDIAGRSERPVPNNFKSYFESEGSSYLYREREGLPPPAIGLQIGGRTMEEVARDAGRLMLQWTGQSKTFAENTIWIMQDYNNFHAERGSNQNRRYLYIDGHVGDYEN